MNWRYNSAQSHRLFARRAAVILSLFISVMHVQAQTQAAMNAQVRAEFEQADAELNKTYEALLAKLPDAESKQKLKEASAHGSPFAMPRQRLQLIRRVAGQWLPQFATKRLRNSLNSGSNS